MGQFQIIKASAGSGKTYRLTLEYIRNLVINPQSYRSILAVTFTNKATSEMKERILKELSLLASLTTDNCHKNSFYNEFLNDDRIDNDKIIISSARALSYILHDYSRFSVSTIDKFFQKIIRSFVKEMGLDGGYNIKFDNDYVVELAIDRVIDSAKYDEQLWQHLQSLISESIGENKSSNLKRELMNLSSKIQDERFDAQRFLAKEEMMGYFTAIDSISKVTKSALRERASRVAEIVSNYNLTQDDMPGKSRGFHPDVIKIKNGAKYECTATSRKAGQGDAKWAKSVDPSIQNEIIEALQDLIAEIDSSHELLVTCDVVLKEHKLFMLLGDISNQIIEIGKETNSLLMSSSMKILSTLTSENDAPFIYEKIGTTYRTYMIDEFQDTSTGQWLNFAPLLNDALSSGDEGDTSVTLLGDVKQSIYGWRGGNWRLLDGELVKDIDNSELIKPSDSLITNWRSKSNIIEFNNKIIASFIANVNDTLNDQLIQGLDREVVSKEFYDGNFNIIDRAYKDLRQEIRAGAKLNEGYIEADIADFGEDENLRAMMLHIEDAQERGHKAGDIAILIHTKKEASRVADYILRYKEENPAKATRFCYDFVSAEALKLISSDSVLFIINLLRASCKKDNSRSVEGVMCNVALGEGYSSAISVEQSDFLDTIRYSSLLDSFERIISNYKLDKHKESMAYIQALHQVIITYCNDNTPDTRRFLEWWDGDGCNSVIYMPESRDSMLIVTIHKSKGLEFPVVILPFCYWKLPPRSDLFWAQSKVAPFDKLGSVLINYAKRVGDSCYAEPYYEHMILSYIERSNMLYVALTRSCEELYIILYDDTLKKSDDNILPSILRTACDSGFVDYIERGDDFPVNRFIKGEKVSKPIDANKPEDSTSTIYLDSYDSYDYNEQLKIKPSTERYYISHEEGYLSPRHYGVIMHKLFEKIESISDIEPVLEEMLADAIISETDKETTLEAINLSLENPIIKEWFEPFWEVKAENDIIIPSSEGRFVSCRPDRVLISGDRAVVIDYKFGMSKSGHLKQIGGYVGVLHDMGYVNVEGYVWYVLENKIVSYI